MAANLAAIQADDIRLQWREARGGQPSTATINFVVYVEREDYREWVSERAQRIADKHPCRMIVLDAVKGEHEVEITAGEPESGQGGAAFRERVDLGVDGIRAAQRIQFVEALLVRDVPSVLWWAADRLFSSNTFTALVPLVQNIILDSSGTDKDPNAIREFASYFSEHRGAALADLAWMRLDPWRDVVAQFFDDPSMHDELFALRSVRVSSGSASEALYLGCWLASRLEWTVKDASTFTDRFGATIAFERKHEGQIRRVNSIELKSANSTYSAFVAGDDAVGLEVSGAFARPVRHVPLQAIDTASLIERAMLGRETDEVFIEALHTVGELLK